MVNISSLPPPTMGCHPMLTESANFVTNALRGDISTCEVRPWCGHHTSSVHQWIGYWILPQFDLRMSSLALLEAEIPSPLYVPDKNNVDVILIAGPGNRVQCAWSPVVYYYSTYVTNIQIQVKDFSIKIHVYFIFRILRNKNIVLSLFRFIFSLFIHNRGQCA